MMNTREFTTKQKLLYYSFANAASGLLVAATGCLGSVGAGLKIGKSLMDSHDPLGLLAAPSGCIIAILVGVKLATLSDQAYRHLKSVASRGVPRLDGPK